MRKLILSLFAILLCAASFAQIKFTTMTFAEAQAKALKANKQLLVDVCMGDKDSPEMAKALKSAELVNYIKKNFLTVRINMLDKANSGFGEHLYSLMYPCVVFYTNRGEQLESSNWFILAKQNGKLLEMAKVSLKNAAIKRNNTRKIEFRDLDFVEALAAAKAEGKMLFVDNYTTWCRPCKQMENDVFTLNAVADFYNEHFVSIKLDADKDPHKVAKNNGVRGYPGYLYFAPDGGVMASEGGYTPEKKFIAYAQNALDTYKKNKEINLTKVENLDEALALAKREGKPLFINVSATWCGPCKQIKATTFKESMVAKYHNENYINVYVETDKYKQFGDALKAKYNYNAFPTFVFTDVNGNMTHKFVGAGIKGVDFIKHSKMGIENNGLASYNAKYAAGDRTPEFMKEYINVLGAANEGETASKVASEFFDNITLEQLMVEDNFKMLTSNVTDKETKVGQLFLNNYDAFNEKYGRGAENFRTRLWYTKARSFVIAGDEPTIDKVAHKAFVKSLKSASLPKEMKENLAHAAKINNAEMTGDWATYIKLANAEFKASGNSHLAMIYNQGLRVDQRCKDAKLRSKMADLIEKSMAMAEAEIKAEEEKAAKIKAESGGKMSMGMSMSSPSMYINAAKNIVQKLRAQ